MAYNHQNGNNGVPLNGYANQQQHNLAMQPQYAEEAARVIKFSSLYDRKNRNTIL